MAIPLIVAGAAVAFGAKKAYDGYQDKSEADEIVQDAEKRYERARNTFVKQEKQTAKALENLDKNKRNIGKSISEFKILADELLKKLGAEQGKNLEISIPQHKLKKESSTSSGITIASTGIGMLIGSSPLVGGGGLSIAGGTSILGAAVAVPVLAIAGWAYGKHGEEALRNARKVSSEANSAIEKLKLGLKSLEKTEVYVQKIDSTLDTLYIKFKDYFNALKDIENALQTKNCARIENLSNKTTRIIENGYALATLLVDLITTPIFKVKKQNGEIVTNDQGVPVIETDSNGSMVLNTSDIYKTLRDVKSLSNSY